MNQPFGINHFLPPACCKPRLSGAHRSTGTGCSSSGPAQPQGGTGQALSACKATLPWCSRPPTPAAGLPQPGCCSRSLNHLSIGPFEAASGSFPAVSTSPCQPQPALGSPRVQLPIPQISPGPTADTPGSRAATPGPKPAPGSPRRPFSLRKEGTSSPTGKGAQAGLGEPPELAIQGNPGARRWPGQFEGPEHRGCGCGLCPESWRG